MPSYKRPVQPQPGKLKIVELFETVQGEGHLVGVPSTFVRTGMCNLQCPGCDTVWDDWTETSFVDVANKIKSFKAKHVVITGGEPTLHQTALATLMDMLPGYHFTVETNGAVPLYETRFRDRVDLFSFSPKVGSLGPDEMTPANEAVVLTNIELMQRKAQIKYVLDPNMEVHVNRVFDFQFIVNSRTQHLKDTDIYFQPYDDETIVNIYHAPGLNNTSAYLSKLAILTKLVMERWGSRFRVLPQMHKLLTYR